jgi:hypothetical protein
VLPNIIFRTPFEHRTVLAHAWILVRRSRELLESSGDVARHLKPEVEATANNSVNELMRLTEKLLRRYGQDIDADNQIVRCFVMSEFLVATYAVQPDLAVYRISQRDIEQNISQLFVATLHWGSGTPDLRLYRQGPWEKAFRKISSEMLDLAPSRHLH